jgi:hypothetical protein
VQDPEFKSQFCQKRERRKEDVEKERKSLWIDTTQNKGSIYYKIDIMHTTIIVINV